MRMVTIRRVSADALDRTTGRPGPREAKRMEVERALERAIQGAEKDQAIAFRLALEEGDKASTVRAAFNRARDRTGATTVNLLTVEGHLYIAQRPQQRGRRAAR